ncbi:MAG TPA: hypothetical protein DEB05_13675 [Firmicutes bacterium]|nr:hypothetical protein [Bacillota bacterium]
MYVGKRVFTFFLFFCYLCQLKLYSKILFAPKYRRKIFYYERRKAIWKILRTLCEWKLFQLEVNCC